MSSEEVMRTFSVSTPLRNISHDAAQAVGLDPERARVTDVEITDDYQLELTLEGPPR